MSVNIQHKLLQYEMPPPAGTWENIARRLDDEFDAADIKVSEKIFDATIEPPANAWASIVAGLDENIEQEPAKVVPLFKRRSVAIAAAIIGLLLAGAWFYRQYSTDNGQLVNSDTTNRPTQNPTVPGNIALVTDDDISSSFAQLIPRKVRVRDLDRSAIIHTTAYNELPIQNDEQVLQEARTVTVQPAHVIDATTDATVSAPLIRDANGNIIMDMSLLTSSSSGNYITVTGPNGEQTRISSKFANFLAFMNNTSSEKEEYLDYLIRNSGAWKKRFDEWRNKILQQASFSPSSATFFDILELKELIKD